jgi:biotin transporter BioY
LPTFRSSRNNIVTGRSKGKSFVAQLVLVLLGIELLFLSGFTALNLPTATNHNLQTYILTQSSKFYSKFSRKFKRTCEASIPHMIPPDLTSLPPVRYSLYVPQAPMAIFLGYVLGWPLAVFALTGYIILGLVGPFFKLYVFAAGTGINYYLQPGFGYLIGMILASACVGWLSRGERKSLNQLLSLFIGLLCIHVIGLAYLVGIYLFGAVHEITGQHLVWSAWVFEEARNLSWYALPYDLIFGLALIGIAFPFRWLVSILTAPDIAATEIPNNDTLVDFKLAR